MPAFLLKVGPGPAGPAGKQKFPGRCGEAGLTPAIGVGTRRMVRCIVCPRATHAELKAEGGFYKSAEKSDKCIGLLPCPASRREGAVKPG